MGSVVLWGILGLLLLGGCAARRGGGSDPVLAGLGSCARSLDPQGEAAEASLDTHIQCLLDASVRWPEDARVHEDVARALHVRALAYPVPGRDDLASSRTWAMRCLSLRPAFAGRLAGTGGQLQPGVLAVLELEDAGCLTWASLSWSRWLQARGVLGVTIDLHAVRDLAARAVALSPGLDGGRPRAALGLALALVPELLEQDLGSAEENLVLAMDAAPERLQTAVDLAEQVLGPTGREPQWRQVLEGVVSHAARTQGLDAYEDRAAQAHARALLEQGLVTPEPW